MKSGLTTKERKKINNHNYYQANKNKILAQSRRSYMENRDEILLRKKIKYYEKKEYLRNLIKLSNDQSLQIIALKNEIEKFKNPSNE